MDTVLNPKLLKYANIPGLVDMVISKDPDASRDDLGLKKKMSSASSNMHKRAVTTYQTPNHNVRSSRTPDLQASESSGNKAMTAIVENQTRFYKPNAARRNSRSIS